MPETLSITVLMAILEIAVPQSVRARNQSLVSGRLPGQIIVDPANPAKLVYNKDDNEDGRLDPFFMCGPGGPEGFLYGDISGGDTPDTVLDKMIKHGGNCIYMQGIRSHGGDGDSDQNPFIDHDPNKGLDQNVLNRWEKWFQRMERHGIVIYFFFYDDDVDLWTEDIISPAERSYIRGIVDAFEHHPNLIWVVAEEYSESFSKAKVSRLAVEIRQADDYDHIIASHQLPKLAFDHADDPVIDQFAMQLHSRSGPYRDIHQKCLEALENAKGRYNVNLAEQYDWHSELLVAGDRDGVRKVNWSAAITGTYVMHLGTWETDRNRKPPTIEMLEDYRRLYAFMESLNDLSTLSPKDNIVQSGTAWVLGNDNHFIAYLINGGGVTLDLSGTAGQLAVEWYNPRKGDYVADSPTAAGGNRAFTAPDNNDWVLHIKTCGELVESKGRE